MKAHATSLDPQVRVQQRFEHGNTVIAAFFETHARAAAGACSALARRFRAGGRLLVLGPDAAASDAAHVAVEFVHPVLVGRRALPALALPPADDACAPLALLGRGGDALLAISHGPPGEALRRGLECAARAGMLTIAFTGGAGPAPTAGAPHADFVFHVASDDALLVQEAQESMYHVLWELVHVFLDAEGA